MLIENPLNASELAFPVLECMHVIGFAISVGTIAIMDSRLLGVGMRHQRADLNRDLWRGDLRSREGPLVLPVSGLQFRANCHNKYREKPNLADRCK
jgi:hypothetical protein